MTSYWHFCAMDAAGRLVLRDGSPAAGVGETERFDGALVMCKTGLHASLRAIDALRYAPGTWCRVVTLGGLVLHEDDKSVATERHIIASFDTTKILHEYACCVAEAAQVPS